MSAYQSAVGPLDSEGWRIKPSSETRDSKPLWKFSLAAMFKRSADRRPIADQSTFRQFLALEEKRAGRSGNSCIIVVLRPKGVMANLDARKVLTSLPSGFFSAIRNTDLLGWYDSNAIGILFTEVAKANQTALSAILSRVILRISSNMTEELLSQIDVSYQMFPPATAMSSSSDLLPGKVKEPYSVENA